MKIVILILLACLPISFGCKSSPHPVPPPNDCSYCPRCVQVEREQVFGGTQADKHEVSFFFVKWMFAMLILNDISFFTKVAMDC